MHIQLRLTPPTILPTRLAPYRPPPEFRVGQKRVACPAWADSRTVYADIAEWCEYNVVNQHPTAVRTFSDEVKDRPLVVDPFMDYLKGAYLVP